MKRKVHAVLIVLSAALFIAAGTGCTAKAKKAYHNHRAEKFFAAGQFDRAEIEYIGVLRNDPENADAISKLGIIYYEEGRFQRAVPFLTRGLQIETNNLDLHLKLGFIDLAVGNAKAAGAEADFILARNPADTEAPILCADIASSPKEIAAARRRLQGLPAAGDNAVRETALGILALHAQDYPAAERALKQAQTLDPKFAAAYSILGSLRQAQNNLTEAAADFKRAAELAAPRAPEKLECAQFEIETGDLPAAKAMFNQLAQATPDSLPVRIGLAEIALAETNLDDCARELSEVTAREPDNCDALLLGGRLALAQGDLVKAVSQMERATQLYPRLPRVDYELAQVYLANREPEKSIGSLQRAIQLDPHYNTAILMLADLEISTANNNDEAIRLLEPLVRRQTAPGQASWLLANAYRTEGRLDDALEIYAQLEKTYPQNPQVPLLAGMACIQKRDAAGARREFLRAQALLRGNYAALEQLTGLDLAEKHFAEATQRMDKAVSGNPQRADLRLLQAKVFLALGETNQAQATLSRAIELQPDLQSAYLLLAQLELNAGQNEKALALAETALAKNPQDAAALMFKGMILTGEGKFQEAGDAYEKVIAKNPDFGPALNNLAWLDCEHLNQPERARQLAQHARQLFPTDPSIADTLGWTLFRQGNYAGALPLLQESARQLTQDPEAQFHLGMVQYVTGNESAARTTLNRALQTTMPFADQDECAACVTVLEINPQTADTHARAFLEKRTADHPNDVIALARLAAIYQEAQEPEKAIALDEALRKTAPPNIIILTNLAALYSAHDPAKAMASAQAAYQLSPNDPSVAGMYGRLAYQNGKYDLAFSLLQSAQNSAPNDPQIQFDYARTAYAFGKISEAQTAMQTALTVGLPPAQGNEARDFLLFLSAGVNPNAQVQNRAQQVLQSDPANVPALMTQAAADQQQRKAGEAERIYETILARFPGFSPAQRNLALLYVADNSHTDRAYALAVKAQAVYPDDLALSKAVAVLVFRQGNYGRAATLFRTIADEANPDAELLYYLGLSEYHLKHFSESKATLQHALALNLPANQATDAKTVLAQLK